jgi:hypothetical protein
VPGHKLLLWIGPGYGVAGSGSYMDLDVRNSPTQNFLYEKVRWLSGCLRQARIVIDSFSVGEDAATKAKDDWKHQLDIPPSPPNLGIMNVYKKTLAVESGGRVLPATEDLAGQIESSVHQADAFYVLTFDPPHTTTPHEYHTLQVGITRPGNNAHLPTWYYNEPYYGDTSEAALKGISTTQLGSMLLPLRSGKPSVPDEMLKRIASVRLSERLSNRRITELKNPIRDSRMADAIQGIADEAAFLPPLPSDILAEPSPDDAAQRQMLAAAADYLNRITPELPNFVASRRTTLLMQSFASPDPSVAALEEVPFHGAGTWDGTVTYRNGSEVIVDDSGQRIAPENALSIYGTFGPFLKNTVGVALTQARTRQAHEKRGFRQLSVRSFHKSDFDGTTSSDDPASPLVRRLYTWNFSAGLGGFASWGRGGQATTKSARAQPSLKSK